MNAPLLQPGLRRRHGFAFLLLTSCLLASQLPAAKEGALPANVANPAAPAGGVGAPTVAPKQTPPTVAPAGPKAPAAIKKNPIVRKEVKPDPTVAPKLTRPFDPNVQSLQPGTGPSKAGKDQTAKIKNLFDRANASGGDTLGRDNTQSPKKKPGKMTAESAPPKPSARKKTEPSNKGVAEAPPGVAVTTTTLPEAVENDPPVTVLETKVGPEADPNPGMQVQLGMPPALAGQIKNVPIDIIGPMPGLEDDFTGGGILLGRSKDGFGGLFDQTGIGPPASPLGDWANNRDPLGINSGFPGRSFDTSPAWGGETGKEIGGLMRQAGGYLGGTAGQWLDTGGKMVGADNLGDTAGHLSDHFVSGSGGVTSSWVRAADGTGSVSEATVTTADAVVSAGAETAGAAVGGMFGGPVGVLVGMLVVAAVMWVYSEVKSATETKPENDGAAAKEPATPEEKPAEKPGCQDERFTGGGGPISAEDQLFLNEQMNQKDPASDDQDGEYDNRAAGGKALGNAGYRLEEVGCNQEGIGTMGKGGAVSKPLSLVDMEEPSHPGNG